MATVGSPTVLSIFPPMPDFLTHGLMNIKEQLVIFSGIWRLTVMVSEGLVWPVGALSAAVLSTHTNKQ